MQVILGRGRSPARASDQRLNRTTDPMGQLLSLVFRNLGPHAWQELRSAVGVRFRMSQKISKSLLALAVGGLMLATSAAAQTSNNTSTSGAGPGVVDPGHPRVNEVNQREQNQQNRIANGLKNDTLNAKQASNLEKREASVQKREQKDMAKNNGHLTKAEQKGINRQQNRISRSIYKDKHEAK
jgi:hypothetical protein